MYNRILSLLGFIISICSIVFLFKLRGDSKLDTFKQPFEVGEKGKLFNSQNISSITSSEFAIKCELYQEAIMSSKVDKLGYVFNLNVENIHRRTTQLVIIFALQILFIVLLIVLALKGIVVYLLQHFGKYFKSELMIEASKESKV